MTATLPAEVLPADVDHASFLAARRHGIGSSDVSAILGLNRWKTARDVWADKTGRAPVEQRSWGARRGVALEPELRQWFSEETGLTVRRSGMLQHPEHPWARYSPDGLIDPDAVWEGKTVRWFLRDDWGDDQTADHAEIQVQWGLWITGRSKAYVTVAISDDEPETRTVERDDNLIAMIVPAVETFWTENILGDVEPAATWADLDRLANAYPQSQPVPLIRPAGDDLDQWITSERFAAAQIKAAQAVRDGARARIMQALADADTLVLGDEIAATWKTQTARVIDRDALAAAGIDLEQFKREQTSRVLRIQDPANRPTFKGNQS